MRLWSWLKQKLAPLWKTPAAYRVNPRALVFGAACWLVFTGVQSWSPPAARVTLGAIFLLGLLWPDPKKGVS